MKLKTFPDIFRRINSIVFSSSKTQQVTNLPTNEDYYQIQEKYEEIKGLYEELKENETRLNTIFENIHDIFFSS